MSYSLLFVILGLISGLKGISMLREEPGEEFARPGTWLNTLFVILLFTIVLSGPNEEFFAMFLTTAMGVIFLLVSAGVTLQEASKGGKRSEGFALAFLWLTATLLSAPYLASSGIAMTVIRTVLGLSLALSFLSYVMGIAAEKPEKLGSRPYNLPVKAIDIPFWSGVFLFALGQESIVGMTPRYVVLAAGLILILVALRQEEPESMFGNMSENQLSQISELKIIICFTLLVGAFVSHPVVYVAGGVAIVLNSLVARNRTLAGLAVLAQAVALTMLTQGDIVQELVLSAIILFQTSIVIALKLGKQTFSWTEYFLWNIGVTCTLGTTAVVLYTLLTLPQ